MLRVSVPDAEGEREAGEREKVEVGVWDSVVLRRGVAVGDGVLVREDAVGLTVFDAEQVVLGEAVRVQESDPVALPEADSGMESVEV